VRIYGKKTVFEAALDRIRWLYNEFPNVAVSMSGGKDSTVLFHLALQVANETGRLPLKVKWLDQELEYEATVEYMKKIMYREDVMPLWYQIPFRLLNATSAQSNWLNVWGEGEEWVREKDPISIKEVSFKADRFTEVLDAINMEVRDNQKTAILTGVRVEESPSRLLGLTSRQTYKWITWGAVVNRQKGVYTFSPLYDWSYTDIWKAIAANNWPVNTHYQSMYQYGVNIRDMRVSNYHHETALTNLFRLQEIEPATYEKALLRISGLATGNRLGVDDFYVHALPLMFKDWLEYRDYLLDTIVSPGDKVEYLRHFKAAESHHPTMLESFYRVEVQAILSNDVGCTKVKNHSAANVKHYVKTGGGKPWTRSKV